MCEILIQMKNTNGNMAITVETFSKHVISNSVGNLAQIYDWEASNRTVVLASLCS
jgi:hypothetical protein